MSEINFLKGAKEAKDKKPSKREPKKIEWSEPKDYKPEDDYYKTGKNFFGLFSYIKNKEKDNLKNKKIIDKIDLKMARKEILKTIKEAENKKIKEKNKKIFKKLKQPDKKTDKLDIKKKEAKEKRKKINLLAKINEYFNQTKNKIKEFSYKQKSAGKNAIKNKIIEAQNKIIADKIIPAPPVEEAEPIFKDLPHHKIIRDDEASKEKKTFFKSDKVDKISHRPSKNSASAKRINYNIWEKLDVLKTNLITSDLDSYFNWRSKILVLSIAIFLSCLIVVIFYGGLVLWGSKNIILDNGQLDSKKELNEKIIMAENEINQVAVLQKKLKLVSNLLDRHIYWTNFFKFLEDNTMTDVYYASGGFSGNTEGKYSFPAMANDFVAIAQQVQSLGKNDLVEEAATNGGTAGEGGQTSFNLSLTLNPDIFYKKTNNATSTEN